MNETEVQKFFDDLCEKYHVERIKIKFDGRLGKHLGSTKSYLNSHKIHSVTINRKILTQSNEVIENILLHEFAHVIDFIIRGRSGHDEEWVKIAESLGIEQPSSEYVVDYDKFYKYKLTCENCGTFGYLNRINKYGIYSCVECESTKIKIEKQN